MEKELKKRYLANSKTGEFIYEIKEGFIYLSEPNILIVKPTSEEDEEINYPSYKKGFIFEIKKEKKITELYTIFHTLSIKDFLLISEKISNFNIKKD